MYSIIKNCQICGNSKLKKLLNLGSQPLCDNLTNKPYNSKFYKIEIIFCNKCLTAFQKYNINKSKLFPKTYHYRSSNTADVINGMKNLTEETKKIFKDLKNKKVLDIGCNDGSLLDEFRKKGATTFGIEPTDAYLEAKKKGHKIYNNFIDKNLAKKLKKNKFDIITFTNVFAHINNFKELINSLKILISKNTILVIENHYLGEVLKKNQFDTFYHEHPRTYSLKSFFYISKLLNMNIHKFSFVKRYNGNIRVFFTNKINHKIKSKLNLSLKKEKLLIKLVSKFQKKVFLWSKNKKKKIKKIVKINGPIPGKAFPGRASIIIKLLNLSNKDISAIYEKNKSLKINKYVPGTNIKIIQESKFLKKRKKTKVLINFAWHISKEIRQYLKKKLLYRGQVIDIISSKDFK